MNDAFSIEASFPPSLADAPLVAMLTVMCFLAIALIAMQWLYGIIDLNRDEPAPPKSYVRLARRVRFWMVIAMLVLTAPRLVTLMLWQVMTPAVREASSAVSWIVGIPGAMMFVYAWWNDRVLVKTEHSYTEEAGSYYPADLVTKSEKTRGALIAVLVFVFAFAITFVRPMPHVDAPVSAVVSSQ